MGRSMLMDNCAFRGVVVTERTTEPWPYPNRPDEQPGDRKSHVVGPYSTQGVAKTQANRLARRYASNKYWEVVDVVVQVADNWKSVG